MNIIDRIANWLERSLGNDEPEKPKRKHDYVFDPKIDYDVQFRLPGYYACIVKETTLIYGWNKESVDTLFPGTILIVSRINTAGLYEPPEYDPEWVMISAINSQVNLGRKYETMPKINLSHVTELVERSTI